MSTVRHWPYEIARVVAVLENDHDVAGGMPVSGATLDILEVRERKLQAGLVFCATTAE